MTVDHETFVSLTAEIVSAHVRNNSVALCDVPVLIQTVLTALQGLGATPEIQPEKLKGAVSVRASIKPDFLISMIPLFTRRTVLVDADAGGVDHHDLAFEGGRNRSK